MKIGRHSLSLTTQTECQLAGRVLGALSPSNSDYPFLFRNLYPFRHKPGWRALQHIGATAIPLADRIYHHAHSRDLTDNGYRKAGTVASFPPYLLQGDAFNTLRTAGLLVATQEMPLAATDRHNPHPTIPWMTVNGVRSYISQARLLGLLLASSGQLDPHQHTARVFSEQCADPAFLQPAYAAADTLLRHTRREHHIATHGAHNQQPYAQGEWEATVAYEQNNPQLVALAAQASRSA